MVTKETLPSVDFTAVRGIDGIKEAEVDLKGTKVKVAVANGLGNARQLMELIKAGKADYQFIEIMCCPGGCIGGGGQPIGTTNEIRKNGLKRSMKPTVVYRCVNPTKIRPSKLCTKSSWLNPWVKRAIIYFTPTIPSGRNTLRHPHKEDETPVKQLLNRGCFLSNLTLLRPVKKFRVRC